MKQAGVDVFFDGSVLYDILVRERQADLAKTILRTNYFTLSGNVRLFSTGDKNR
jgi:hypothetical protein